VGNRALHGVESKVADCEFVLRQWSRDPSGITVYKLRQVAANAALVRELLRKYGKIRTEFWYDLPPYKRKVNRKPKKKGARA
jgi:hypothetical protein